MKQALLQRLRNAQSLVSGPVDIEYQPSNNDSEGHRSKSQSSKGHGSNSQSSKGHLCRTSAPEQHTALVAEGGGQRGVFTAGILDAWLHAGFNPFEILIGTSAGAQNLSSYMTCQPGFGLNAITEFSSQPQFFKWQRSLIGKHAVDLDWYFDQLNSSASQLDIDCGQARLKNRQLYFSATRVHDRRAEFFSPDKNNWLEMLKASSALPMLYKGGVKIGDDFFVDGGLSAPLPVEEAYQRGARKITVLRTVAEDASMQSPWAHKIKSMICNQHYCPKVIDLLTHHEDSYQRSLEFINNPPADVEIVQLFPQQALASSLVGSSKSALQQDYQLGVTAGIEFLKQTAA